MAHGKCQRVMSMVNDDLWVNNQWLMMAGTDVHVMMADEKPLRVVDGSEKE